MTDLQASIRHYVERFGFSLDFQGPPGDVYYAHGSRDGIGIMLKAIAPEVPPQPNSTRHPWARWDAYINMSDPDMFAFGPSSRWPYGSARRTASISPSPKVSRTLAS